MNLLVVGGIERSRQALQASDILRLRSVLRLLQAGRPMLSIHEYADVLQARQHQTLGPRSGIGGKAGVIHKRSRRL